MGSGLSSEQAADRLEAEGYNELPPAGEHSFYHIVLSVISEPMFGLLLAAGAVYFLLGDFTEAVTISLFALLSVGIAIIQEWRSEHVLEALRDLSSPRAMVVRDGKPTRIAGREVVRDDLVILSEGDRVPADATIISDDSVLVDESLLTGESIAVKKSKLKSDSSLVFAGTLIVRGNAKAIVTATGLRTEIGKIGNALYSIKPEPPPLQKQTAKVVRFFAFFGISLSAVCTVLYGLWRHDWLAGTLNGIALGMSLLPEEFPLVLTVFMTMGAWRISRAKVLTRKASAIETLGSATVLCTDKTGTLTQNRMSIALAKSGETVWKAGEQPSRKILDLLQAGLRASHKDSYDPMDLAFFQLPLPDLADTALPHARYGLKPEFLMTASAYKTPDGYKILAKGAPETVAHACRFTAKEIAKLQSEIDALAAQGLRVLGVAEGDYSGVTLPVDATGFSYRFLGLVGFADPLREDVPAAVEQCRLAGIRVVMITGDYPATACAIARQAGLNSPSLLTGPELRAMTDLDLREEVKSTNVFARITPDQKLRIVTALKGNGEIVAMTGDGVNDAPSLKAAHIGVAMGGRGTDVAREAASIVLLDDSFSSLVNTISLGRRIYDNLRKAMIYICAIHVPIAGLALFPLIFNMPLILTPLLIALIEMVIDPTCSVVLEAEEAEDNVMRRPPRSPSSSLLSPPVLLWGLAQGLMAMGVLAAVWFMASWQTAMPANEIRSLLFASLLVINLVLILANRSFSPSLLQAFERKNPFLGWGSAGIFLFFGILLYWPAAKKLFDFGPVHLHDVGYAVGSGLLMLLALETAKSFVWSKISK